MKPKFMLIISSQGKPSTVALLLSRQEGKRAKELLQQPQQGIHIQSRRKGGSTPVAALLNDSIKFNSNNKQEETTPTRRYHEGKWFRQHGVPTLASITRDEGD
eukprot:scaffold4282_cov112-Cylindrotheca_fusiformis.AAC.5